jgi:hypothetical protein
MSATSQLLLSNPPEVPAVEPGPITIEWDAAAQQRLVELDVKDGKISQKQADAQLADLAPTAEEIDQAFPPAAPHEYRLPAFGEQGKPITTEVIELDRSVRTWLVEGRFPAPIGSDIVREAVHVAGQQMTEQRRQQYALEQRAQMHGAMGMERAEQRIKLAADLIDELDEKSGGQVVDWLLKTGAIYSAKVLTQVALQAERLQARKRRS